MSPVMAYPFNRLRKNMPCSAEVLNGSVLADWCAENLALANASNALYIFIF